jgi:hypothetical protein
LKEDRKKELEAEKAKLSESEKEYYELGKRYNDKYTQLKEAEKEEKRLEKEIGELKERNKTAKEGEALRREKIISEYERRLSVLRAKSAALRTDRDGERDAGKRAGRSAKAAAVLSKREALKKLKTDIRETQTAKRAAERLLAEKKKKVDRIMREAGTGIWHTQRDQIRALQALFIAGARKTVKWRNAGGTYETITVDEFKAKAAAGEIDSGLLNKKLQSKLYSRDVKELFDSELDAVLEEINALALEGRAVWREKEQTRLHEERRTGGGYGAS